MSPPGISQPGGGRATSGMAANVAVVVVSHDSGQCLLDCITDLLAQDDALEIVVVDNASRDGAPQALAANPRVKTLLNAGNPGVGAACNQGANASIAPYLLFVNPDCRLPREAVRTLRETLQTASNNNAKPIGMLGAQLLNEDGSEQAASRRSTPKPMQAIRAMVSTTSNGTPSSATDDAASVENVDAISGALMMIPRAVFDRLSGFDTAYVLHCEDLDMCRRVLAQGYAVALAPKVRITHLKGTSSRKRPVWVEWQKHRGMLRYFRKFDAAHSPWWLKIAVPLGIAAHFPLAGLRAWWRA